MGPQGLIEEIGAIFPGETTDASVDHEDLALTVSAGRPRGSRPVSHGSAPLL